MSDIVIYGPNDEPIVTKSTVGYKESPIKSSDKKKETEKVKK